MRITQVLKCKGRDELCACACYTMSAEKLTVCLIGSQEAGG